MDDKLTHLLMNTPERSIILLEDVDAAFNKRVQSSEDGYAPHFVGVHWQLTMLILNLILHLI